MIPYLAKIALDGTQGKKNGTQWFYPYPWPSLSVTIISSMERCDLREKPFVGWKLMGTKHRIVIPKDPLDCALVMFKNTKLG